MTQVVERTTTTPPKLAAEWGVDVEKVLYWIRTGELSAIDASTRRGERPRYLIRLDDKDTFWNSRRVVPVAKPARRKKTSMPPGFVRNFR